MRIVQTGAQITAAGLAADGSPVQRIVLRSDRLEVSVLTLGAILQSCRLDGRASCVVGFPTAEGYTDDMRYCGAIVGPVANRLSGAEAMIGAELWRFVPNEGRNLLHGGSAGFDRRVWQIADISTSHVTLRLEMRHCEGGFPGNRVFEACYRVAGRQLMLDLVSRTDRLTLANLAPHAYWNLRGGGDITGHVLRIAADTVLQVGPDLCPLGAPEPVAGAFDLRQGRRLATGEATYDHNFCTARTRVPLRVVATLSLPDDPAAPRLEIATTEPGLQVYDGARHATRPFFGVAIESQCWPDAPRNPDYPSILLTPEDGALVQQTVWTLYSGKEGA